METSVALQNLASYSKMLIIPTTLLIVIPPLIYFVYWLIMRQKGWMKNRIRKMKPKEGVEKIRSRYLISLQELSKKCENEEISVRDGYLELSRIFRSFVYEMTGKQVTNMSLVEIRSLRMQVVEQMIEECYVPEFAIRTTSDVLQSIDKAGKVIQQWR